MPKTIKELSIACMALTTESHAKLVEIRNAYMARFKAAVERAPGVNLSIFCCMTLNHGEIGIYRELQSMGFLRPIEELGRAFELGSEWTPTNEALRFFRECVEGA